MKPLVMIALGGIALFAAAPAYAELDALSNEATEPGPPPENDGGGISRDDFGECAVNLNFDELTGGGNACNGDHITTQYPGLSFDVPLGDCVVCANSFLGGLIPNNSDPNVGFAQQNTNVCSAQNDHALVEFSPPVQRVGTDYFTSANATFTLRIYDSGGGLIDELTVMGSPNGGFLSGFAGLDAGSAIIASAQLLSRPTADPTNPFNFSIDDFIYEEECPSPTLQLTWGRVKSLHR